MHQHKGNPTKLTYICIKFIVSQNESHLMTAYSTFPDGGTAKVGSYLLSPGPASPKIQQVGAVTQYHNING